MASLIENSMNCEQVVMVMIIAAPELSILKYQPLRAMQRKDSYRTDFGNSITIGRRISMAMSEIGPPDDADNEIFGSVMADLDWCW